MGVNRVFAGSGEGDEYSQARRLEIAYVSRDNREIMLERSGRYHSVQQGHRFSLLPQP